jgi:hypothetical protein
MRTTLLVRLLCFLVSGCAGVDCTSDAYALGLRDGRLGAQLDAQADLYGTRCGAPIDKTRYAEGLRDGLRARPNIAAF